MAESDELPVFHVVGFTGHRQLADLAGVERTVREIRASLRMEAGVEWLTLSAVAAGRVAGELWLGAARAPLASVAKDRNLPDFARACARESLAWLEGAPRTRTFLMPARVAHLATGMRLFAGE